MFELVWERICKRKIKIRTSGSDYLAFTLLNVVIDNYVYILGVYGEKMETLEGRLILDTNKETLKIIDLFKHEPNIYVWHKACPKDDYGIGEIGYTDFIHEENEKHYTEFQDNINHALTCLIITAKFFTMN